jgi:hypothetical protein
MKVHTYCTSCEVCTVDKVYGAYYFQEEVVGLYNCC